MKKDVIITIKGVQTIEGDQDTVELTTTGSFYRKNDTYYLSYLETGPSGFEGHKTTLKLEQERRITLLRHGGEDSSLVVEQGVRHQCCYDTGYGAMLIGVSGRSIENDITDDGGCVHFQYSLDINTMLTSIHDIYVTVKTYENEMEA